jgi:hypothetical protein
MLINIGSDSNNVKNSLVAVQTLDSVFQFDAVASDLFRVWLHSVPAEAGSREQICSEISTQLSKRSGMENDVENVAAKYPSIFINESLMSLIRSKILKNKFKGYFTDCLKGMVR